MGTRRNPIGKERFPVGKHRSPMGRQHFPIGTHRELMSLRRKLTVHGVD